MKKYKYEDIKDMFAQRDYELLSKLENFHKTQFHDNIKNNYCLLNNIPLIRAPYWEKNNLEKYIVSRLQQYIPKPNKIIV